jgi:hypothetical protein
VYEVVYSFAVHMLLAVFVVFCLRGGGGGIPVLHCNCNLPYNLFVIANALMQFLILPYHC